MVFKVGDMLGLFKLIQNALVIFVTAVLMFGCEPADPNVGNQNENKPFKRSDAFNKTNWVPDSNGNRYFLPSGFVINMEEEILYDLADFKRISRYGANCIVIRIGIGNLGAWPGYEPNQEYLEKLDSYVNYAAEVGLKVIFKMTVYDIRGEVENLWRRLLKTNSVEQKQLLAGWKILWEKYTNNHTVLGYDLINEPMYPQGSKNNAVQVTNNQLVPLYHQLISELRLISKNKWAIYQPLLNHEGTGDAINLPFVQLEVPINDDRLIYAPHAYYDDLNKLENAVSRHLKESDISGAKMMMGEWGRHTAASMDTTFEEQQEYYELYVKSAEIYEKNGVGLIKAWFRGTPQMLRYGGRTFTWSIFRDTTGVGTTERKYIVDVISRPKPLYMTAVVEKFGFDFPTRKFSMTFRQPSLNGKSEIYVPLRHYPDGFTVIYNDSLRLIRPPKTDEGLIVTKGKSSLVRNNFSYDIENERLLINSWPTATVNNTLKIIPGVLR